MKILRCIIFLLLLPGYTFAQDVVAKYSAGKLHAGTTLQHTFFLVKSLPGVKKADLKRNQLDVVRALPNGYSIVRAHATRVTTASHLLRQIHYANNQWKLSESFLKLTTNSENLFTVKVSDIKTFE